MTGSTRVPVETRSRFKRQGFPPRRPRPDVTLRPGSAAEELRIGLRWNFGDTEDIVTHRRPPLTQWRRTTPAALALARQVGPALSNPELAAALNSAGHTTGTGQPFDTTAAGNLLYAYRIGSPNLLTDGELTPRAVAERLGVATGVVHAWLAAGTLTARRSPAGRWCIPFPPEVEADCRTPTTTSAHLHHDADGIGRQPRERSLAEVDDQLGVKADVVYYWGHTRLPTHPPRLRRPALGHPHPRTPSRPPRPAPKTCPKMSKPHTTWKGSQYEVTVPVLADRVQQARVAGAPPRSWMAAGSAPAASRSALERQCAAGLGRMR